MSSKRIALASDYHTPCNKGTGSRPRVTFQAPSPFLL